MATGRDLVTTPAELRAIVHIAGPIETEPGVLALVYTQRCLRCDELLSVWKRRPPRAAFPVGCRVAVDAYQGIAGGRATANRPLRADEADCVAVPAALL